MFRCSELLCFATYNTILAVICGMQALLYQTCSIWFLALSPCPQQRHVWRPCSLSTIYGGKASLLVSLPSLLWGVLTGPITLTRRLKAQYGKSTKERQMEKSRRRTDSPWRTDRNAHLLLLFPFLLGTSGSFQKKLYQYIMHWYQYIIFLPKWDCYSYNIHKICACQSISIKFESVSSAKIRTKLWKICILREHLLSGRQSVAQQKNPPGSPMLRLEVSTEGKFLRLRVCM